MEISPPRAYANLRSTVWKRIATAMQVMATTGYSVRRELMWEVSIVLRVVADSGTVKRLFERELPQAGLIISATLPYIGKSRVALSGLSLKGVELCREIGLQPVESEWDRVRRKHQGEAQPKHTASLLSFAYQARRRHGTVTILPDFAGHFQPDAQLILDGGVSQFVEVENGHGKLDKWRRLADIQGHAAICTNTPVHRRKVIEECKSLGIRGVAADLKTLSQEKGEDGWLSYLWLEDW